MEVGSVAMLELVENPVMNGAPIDLQNLMGFILPKNRTRPEMPIVAWRIRPSNTTNTYMLN
jgi:hypothetical protein